MIAGNECLPVLGEKRPRKATHQSVLTRASEGLKPCLHSTLATMFLLARHFLSTLGSSSSNLNCKTDEETEVHRYLSHNTTIAVRVFILELL